MKKDKLRLYVLEMFLVLFLMLTLFSSRLLSSKISIALFLLLYAILVKKNVKSLKTISIHKKEVTLYMILFAIFYILIYYIIGYYVGYYKATYKFSFWTITNQIFPLILIIISSEILRKEFLSDKSKISLIITFIYGILVDLVIYTNIYDLTNLAGFLEAMGYVFFASIASNILYNYVSYNFGVFPNIIYRIITIIYLYIIPVTPDVHMYFKSFARIVYPVIIYFALINTYEKKNMVLTIKNRKLRTIVTIAVIIVITLFTMLITCRFKYGIIVIGSGSMTGALDVGDAVIFDSKNDYEKIKEGEVLLFNKNDVVVIHRIINIEEINGQRRYYTKGDNNIQMDPGYVTDENVRGIVKVRLKKIGLPTLWFNELFK